MSSNDQEQGVNEVCLGMDIYLSTLLALVFPWCKGRMRGGKKAIVTTPLCPG